MAYHEHGISHVKNVESYISHVTYHGTLVAYHECGIAHKWNMELYVCVI